MDQISIIVFAISISIGMLCNATRRSLLEYHITDSSGKTNSIDLNCVCLPKVENGQFLPDLIDAERHGLERLVIYFYIDSQTHKITAYTPNTEKQYLFPDLSFDFGDGLINVLIDESVNSIVALSANKIMNTKGGHNPNHLNIDENVEGEEFITNVPNLINIGGTDSNDILKDVKLSVIEPIKEIIEINNDMSETITPENHAAILVNHNSYVKLIESDNLNQETSSAKNTVHHLFPAHNSAIELQNINQTPLNNVANEWQTNSIKNIYNWNDYIFQDKYQQPVVDSQNIQHNGFLKFDQWFQQQMDSFVNKKANNYVNFPDDAVLKSLVYKNLFQNGMFLMDNGILKTTQGDTLSLSNLKLQPIIVGLSLDYNYPIPGVPGKIIPPYYDALALYIDDPQKILGIIPLNTADSLDSMGYTTMQINELIPSLVASAALNSHCLNNRCHTDKIAKGFPFRSRKPQKEKEVENDTVIHAHMAEKPGNEEVRMNIYRGTEDTLGLINLQQLDNAPAIDKSTRFPVINDVLKKIYELLLSDETVQTAGKKTTKYEDPPVADEGPGIRIIGGSAATGSGTPISSQG